MTNHAPLKNISPQVDRPHDTTRKPIDRRHVRVKSTSEQKLRTLCHLQGMLIDLQNEKAANVAA